VFESIIGYEDIKEIFIRSLKATRVHILLYGPPASAKTVFLLELQKLKNAQYILGGTATKEGIIDVLLDSWPDCRYLLIDELDKMRKHDYTVLLSLMETGIVRETKRTHAIYNMMDVNVYAAANEINRIPIEVLDRFSFKFYLPEYDVETFINIASSVLVNLDKVKPAIAKYIVSRIAKSSKSIRECRGIAKIVKSIVDADRIIDIIEHRRKKFNEMNE